MQNKRILITNDDGIDAPGISILARVFTEMGAKVTVVAPDSEMSAVSHAITFRTPLRMTEVKPGFFAVTGTPADCTYMGLFQVLDSPPDMVLSGINDGYNLGSDVFYSGTFAGAFEGALRGIPSMAVSTARGANSDIFTAAAKAAVVIAQKLMTCNIPEGTVFNMNHPETVTPDGLRTTPLGVRTYNDQVEKRLDPKGVPYYWIGGPASWDFTNLQGGERDALDANCISLTPMNPMHIAHTVEFDHLHDLFE